MTLLATHDDPRTSREMQAVDIAADRAPVINADASSIMAVISRAAADPSTDVDKLERLLGMYERITERGAKAAYTAALAVMQPELPIIGERGEIRHGDNKPVQSTYARWDDINEAIKPVLAAHDFALSHRIGQAGDKVTITGVLSHAQGHTEETTITLPVDMSGSKNGVQGVGSSISYGQRYTAKVLLNLTSRRSEDDDGRAAGGAEGLNAGQIKVIDDLLEKAGGDRRKFLEYYGVEKIADIPAKAFNQAVHALNQRAAAR
jgi:hypothetical protein